MNFVPMAKRIVVIIFCVYLVFSARDIFAQNKQLRPKIEFDAVNARDPFQDYISPAEEVSIEEKKEEIIKEGIREEDVFNPPSLAMQGIIWGGVQPCVIINGEVKKEGEVIQDVKILKIEREGLELLFRGRKYNLPYVSAAPERDKNNRRK